MDDKILDLEKIKTEREAAALKHKFEQGMDIGNGAICHLTTDQYELLSNAAHEICVSACKGDKNYGYQYVDILADFTSMITGIYPEQDLLKYVWYKATELKSKGMETDINKLLEILIGKFTYDKHPDIKEVNSEELKEFTKEQIIFLKTVMGASDPHVCEKLLEPLQETMRNLVYVGPSKL